MVAGCASNIAILFRFFFSAPSTTSVMDVRKFTAADVEAVADSCFQCKLCEVQCPYTPADGHEFQPDFPKLIHRYTAQKGPEDRLDTPETRFWVIRTGVPSWQGQVWPQEHHESSPTPSLVYGKVLGVYRDKLLP